MSIGTVRAAFAKGRSGERPTGCTDKHLIWLDELRESGECNMIQAAGPLLDEFDELSEEQASAINGYWIATFGQKSR